MVVGSGSGTPAIPGICSGGGGTRRDLILGQQDHQRKCMSLSWIAKKYIVISLIFYFYFFVFWTWVFSSYIFRFSRVDISANQLEQDKVETICHVIC